MVKDFSFLLVPSKNKTNQIVIFHRYLVISNLSPSVITIDKHYLNHRKKNNLKDVNQIYFVLHDYKCLNRAMHSYMDTISKNYCKGKVKEKEPKQ